jgi:hypothetical protein
MPAVAWVTLVAAALIIALTAVALLRVIVHLTQVKRTLDATIGGVESIAQRTSTVPARLTSVNATLEPVRDWAEGV